MAETLCGYPDRDEVLVTYLYDGMNASARATFDAHLAICAKCRQEVLELSSVREQLAGWKAPGAERTGVSPVTHASSGRGAARRWGHTLPVWVQVAAAMLVLGVSAGLANLDIRYDQQGLSVRTGWSKTADARAAQPPAQSETPWRADLTALEQQLRSELRPAAATSTVAQTSTSPDPRGAAADAELLRKVRALVEASEKRQQTELALRVTDVMNHMTAQRNADLMKIDSALGTIQSRTDSRLLQQKATLNYLVSATQKQ